MALTPKMVTIDCANPRQLAEFWSEAVGYQVAADFEGIVVLKPAEGDGIAIGLQLVPEPRTCKNRVHVDWRSEDRPAEVERLVKLGASVIGEQRVPGLTWSVLSDPEGNEFCVAG
jgi:predicted enzyme related to lactoylglutathione lyase